MVTQMATARLSLAAMAAFISIAAGCGGSDTPLRPPGTTSAATAADRHH